MFTLAFSLLLAFFLNSEIELHYYYFGNSDLVGVGTLENGKKTGEWKVYSKINPDRTNNTIYEEVNPQIFERFFNQESPIYIINFSEDLPNGIFQENYPMGSIKTLAFLENGKMENEFKEFFESGELKQSGQFMDGKKSGEWLEYFESGQIKSSITYNNGNAEGAATYFFPDGKVEYKLAYLDGEMNGSYEGYFPNGDLKEKGDFKMGFPDGDWISKTLDRETKFQGNFQNGVRTGDWIEMIEILPEYSRKGSYLEGLKDGEWIVIDGEGKHVQTENFQAGRLMSVLEIRNEEKIKNQQILKKGNGQRIFFDEQGFIKVKGKVVKGVNNGTWFYYYPNSNRLASSGKLIGSTRVGNWKFYNFDGEVIDEIAYNPNQKDGDELNGVGTPNYYRLSPTKSNDSLGAAYEKFYPFNQYRIGN